MNINKIKQSLSNTSLTIYECKRCGWKWMPRRLEPPKACPACQSKKWNIDK